MDENVPLLANPEAEECEIGERLDEDARKDIVGFDPAGDPENPMEWPVAYKWGIVALLALTAFTVYVPKLLYHACTHGQVTKAERGIAISHHPEVCPQQLTFYN